ncbi:hotdog fold thioesterase [Tsukamurella tyrosinosolvens]|uniref:hotdog fold thioesterase n=1 Tax=Tsukamurella tyrosinosolvens TaxID=57704 RepID=UPI000DF6B1E3|nr:hotdog fold thioesterase [Tsukamurella tyrosinosolvens]QRY84438.1 hotdog fold thioesterase [Tsukamurella tyrosinosolvens]RDB48416.1 hotdog fold thioesterase [Tsukamurella tyrosinosolvens]
MSTQQPVDRYAQFLGIEVTGHGGGRAVSTVTVTEDHLNPHDTTHGAFIFALVGTAVAAAANDDEHTGVASAIHIDYLRPTRLGDALTAEAVVGERLPKEDLFVIRVTRDADGEVVARATARFTRRARAR